MTEEELRRRRDVDSSELEEMLENRKEGKLSFLLVDVREEFEYEMGHIPGVDLLRPTSSFAQWAEELAGMKEHILVLTCRTANRSYQVQQILGRMGHPAVVNHRGGIVSWHGPVEEGEA